MQTLRKRDDAFRDLVAAVISRALDDLRGIQLAPANPEAIDQDMAWINGPDCEALCLFLEIDPAAIREKAAALYREFLAREETILLSRSTQTAIQKTARKPRKRPGYGFLPPRQ
jgi:hypothetical protein